MAPLVRGHFFLPEVRPFRSIANPSGRVALEDVLTERCIA